jgi:ABC-2 type transport system permease protein
MLVCAQFLSGIAEMLVPLALFSRFKVLDGWILEELAILYGIVHTSFSIAEMLGRGFDRCGEIIRRGDFDRVLLRPIGTVLQVATAEMVFFKLGRCIQGLLAMFWGLFRLNIPLFSIQGAVLFLSVVGTAVLFYAVFVMQAALSFFLQDALQLMNITTYGCRTTAEYPLKIYHIVWQLFCTLIVPLACVVYYPVLSILGKGCPMFLGVALPFCSGVFLWIAFRFWDVGVRHYHSTGS